MAATSRRAPGGAALSRRRHARKNTSRRWLKGVRTVASDQGDAACGNGNGGRFAPDALRAMAAEK